MKKFLFITLLLLSISLVGFAQQGRRGGLPWATPEEVAKHTTEWMAQELNLSEEQIAPVDSINLIFAKAQRKIFEEIGENFEGIRETMQALEVEKTKALSKVLFPEQLKLYEKKRDEMRENRRRGN